MSDITELLNDSQQKQKIKSDVIRRELERRSHDKVAVFNPTDKDYQLKYDHLVHVIPNKNKDLGEGKGTRVFERFLAERYLKHMTTKIIFERLDVAIKKENERRLKLGMAAMNKWEEEFRFSNSVARGSDPELRKEIMSVLFLGVREEFGKSLVSEVEKKRQDFPLEFEFMVEKEKDTIIPSKDKVEVDITTNRKEASEELKNEAVRGVSE